MELSHKCAIVRSHFLLNKRMPISDRNRTGELRHLVLCSY